MSLLLSIVFFTQFTSPYETRAFVNLESNFIIYARFYQGNLISIDSIISIPEYLSARLKQHNQKLLLNELKREMVKKGGYASKGLIGTFEIPLPKGGFSEFMGETGKLDVGGYVKITLGGSETFLSNYPGYERPSFLPELEMKQEMAINLDGEVGDRMEVYIDHNSERVNESENKITVTYKGKEDEIIQEIEGGDTQLSIPATTYTGDIPSHRGLFGIKSTAKIGPLDLVAIASNEQTQTQEWVYEGAVRADTGRMWAKEYAKRQFFWLGTNDSIISVQIYVDDNNIQNNNNGITYYGIAYLDNDDDNEPDDTTKYEKGYFTLIREGQDYLRYGDIIELNTGLQKDYEAMGVYYEKIVNGNIIKVGILPDTTDTTIQLKLICPRSLDTTSVTWKNYELKNYYQLVTPGSRLDSLRIYYIESGGRATDRNDTGMTFLRLLDLDRNNDELLDENRVWFPGRGLLIFPEDQPFASDTLDNPDPEIYTNPYYMDGPGKYYLYKKTIEAKPVITLPLDAIGVTVFVDEILQDSITDYHVDYEQGKLEFKKPIPPTSRIRIKVEYSPFFSMSQKSLVGVRGSIKTLGQGTLGSSFFYRTEGYPSVEHIRLREESFNRMVFETDFALPMSLPGLTKFVDWLPLIQTEAESKLNLSFEGAYSISNLNSEGEVYLDDLESSTISNEVEITRLSWVPCSKPVDLDTANFVHQRLIWYNPQDQEQSKPDDIYENPEDPNEIINVLKIIFKPDDSLSFSGLTQYTYGKNFDECENLELIIKGKGGRVHIDLSQNISEDQLRRNRQGVLVGIDTLQDEDQRPSKGTWTRETEDTGLDYTLGDDDSNIAGDDGNDDFNLNDYTGGVNGTENNGIWDTEDIDRDGSLNDKNWYYSYSVTLDSTDTFYVGNAGLIQGWKMFRIPIKDSLVWDTVRGQPDWHNIRYIRIWFDHFANKETLLIYKLDITGSKWKNYGVLGDSLPVDSTEVFTLTPVNTKTHTYYKPPYPLEIDPQSGRVKTEGGLEFKLENIKEGHSCVAQRRTEAEEDYRAYDTLTFFLKALHSMPLVSIRIGADSLNYYEYTAGYNSGTIGYNDYRLFKVYMANFLQLKRHQVNDKDTLTDGNYTVAGNSSLSSNRFFEIKIKNQFTTPLTDTIWFNDVKLVSPKTDIGRTVRANGAINFADFSSFSFAFDESNGRFKRLSDSKEIADQSAGQNYAVGANVSLNKLLPENWSFNIPVALNYHKSRQEPRFSNFANDLELIGAEREKEVSTSISRSYTLHISKANSKNWLLKQTMDRLSFDHNRSQAFFQSAQHCDSSEVINYQGSYTLDPKLSFKLLNQTFSVFPQNLSFGAAYTDNFVKSYYRAHSDSTFKLSTIQKRKTLNPSFSTSYSPHSILNTNFNLSQSRDSVSEKKRLGEEVGRNQSFNATLTKDLKIISPTASFNSSYNEDHRFEIRDTADYRNVSNNSRYGINSQVDLKRIVKFFTRLRDESKDSLLMPGSPMWIVKQVEQFVDYLQNPSLSFSRQRSSSYLQVKGRPALKYQWGIVDSIPSLDISPNSYPGRGMTDNYGITSGMNYKFVSISASYNGMVGRTFLPSGDENRTTSRSYPNANLRISRVEALPLLKKYTNSSSITSGYNQTMEYRYAITNDSTKLDSDSKQSSFNPLLGWQANWIKGITSTVEINYNETNSHQYSGTSVVPARSLSRGGSVSLAYTFSAPRGINLPFMKGIKFASNLSTNLSISYNRNTSYSLDLQNPTNNTSTLSTMLGLSYNFSTSVTGGANFDYTQNKETNSEQDSKRVGLNIWMNINF